MKRNQWKNILPCIWSTAGIFVFSGTLFLLYSMSRYLPLQLGGIFLLLLGVVNLLLLLFGWEPPSAAAEEDRGAPEEARTTVSAEGEQKAPKRSMPRDRIDWKKALKASARALVRLLLRIYRPLQIVLLAAALIGSFFWFGAMAWSAPAEATPAYWHLVVLVAAFVVAIILDKLCKHTKTENRFCAMLLRNARAFFALPS